MSRRWMRRIVAAMLFLAGTGGDLWIAGRAGGRSGTAAAVDSQAGGATGLEAEPASGGRAIFNHGERPATADCAGGVVAASELDRGDGAGTIQFSVGGVLVEIEGCGALSVDRGGPGIFAERFESAADSQLSDRARRRAGVAGAGASDARGYYRFGGPAIPPGVAGDCDPGYGEGTSGSGGAAFKSGHQSATKPRRSQRGNRERMLSGGECCPQVCSF